MAVLGWIALGLATAVMRSSFRRGGEPREGLAASCALAVVGALLAGLAAAGDAGWESESLDRNW